MSMKKNSESSQASLGEETDVKSESGKIPDVLSVEVIEKWLNKDLLCARMMLDSILTDKDLRIHMATFMQGRYSNFKNRPVVDPAQTDLFNGVPK